MWGEFFFDADYDPRTQVFSVTQHQYIKDIVARNHKLKTLDSNGFTDGRTLRQIGSIPTNEWHRLGFGKIQDRAERELKIRKYLAGEGVGSRTVDALKHDGPSDGHIIVKK